MILLIGDGFGPAYATLGRAMAGRNLALDAYLVGSAGTAAFNTRVTDSGAAATALACGVVTFNGAIGVDSDSIPRLTILEAAEARGMATGLVATSRITHATPACFAAHNKSRAEEDDIASQMIASGVDVLLGGGLRHFLPAPGGSRDDGRDLLREARTLGFQVVTGLETLQTAGEGPLLGLFGESHLNYVLDREPGEPSLPFMTRVALERLSGDPDGLFLMVEGSRIDHAGHVNDPAAAAHEVLEFDSTFSAVLDFARREGSTLVVVTADHETGGLSLGTEIDGEAVYAFRPEALKPVRRSTEAMASRIAGGANVREVLSSDAGIHDMDVDSAAAIARPPGDSVIVRLGHAISRRAVIGWTTLGHTGVDVPVYAFGPGSEAFGGHHHLAEIGRAIGNTLGLQIGGPVQPDSAARAR